ncbi:MAG: hypothetical protein WKF83_12415 [Nocardioidaceae bacterium]
MLLHGDELGRTQRGNNNVYCQDNELSWVDWAERRRLSLLDFTEVADRAARRAPGLPASPASSPGPRRDDGVPDIAWLHP